MNTHEEEIQKNLEAGKKPSGDEMDVKAYEQVFRALKHEPEFKLSPHFADGVVQRVVRDQRAQGFNNEYFWFGVGIVLLLIAFGFAISQTEFSFNVGFLSTMSAYKGLLIFGAVFIALLQWLDKRILDNRKTSLN